MKKPLALAVLLLLSGMALTSTTATAGKKTWEGTLVGGLPPATPVGMCDEKTACPAFGSYEIDGEYYGVVLRDIDVSGVMAAATDPVEYELWDMWGYAPITVFRLCMYDGQDALIRCDEAFIDYIPLMGELPAQTESVRILLAQNQAVEYYLALFW